MFVVSFKLSPISMEIQNIRRECTKARWKRRSSSRNNVMLSEFIATTATRLIERRYRKDIRRGHTYSDTPSRRSATRLQGDCDRSSVHGNFNQVLELLLKDQRPRTHLRGIATFSAIVSLHLRLFPLLKIQRLHWVLAFCLFDSRLKSCNQIHR